MQRHSSWPHSIGNHANTQVRVCQHHENANNSDSHLSKRSGTSHHGGLASLEHTDYTIAWICALQTEMEAAKAMLDTIHQPLSTDVDDKNIYVLGSIKGHHVVIGYFPSDVHQTLNSTMAITNMMHSFPKINMGLLVGTGGSVPSKVDVRLGDIVVGTSVLQFDFGKLGGDGQLNCRATKTKPSMSLCTAVTSLRAKHELDSSRVPFILQEKLKRHQEYSLPRVPDWLFHAMCSHKSSKPRCDSCDLSQIVPRSARKPNDVKIHHGAIASGNRVIKNATARDRLGQELDVICFETQAAGVMNVLPCLPILGISNYSDSHESEEWNKYAAATAAAYARELLESIPIHKARSIVSSHDSCKSTGD